MINVWSWISLIVWLFSKNDTVTVVQYAKIILSSQCWVSLTVHVYCNFFFKPTMYYYNFVTSYHQCTRSSAQVLSTHGHFLWIHHRVMAEQTVQGMVHTDMMWLHLLQEKLPRQSTVPVHYFMLKVLQEAVHQHWGSPQWGYWSRYANNKLWHAHMENNI